MWLRVIVAAKSIAYVGCIKTACFAVRLELFQCRRDPAKQFKTQLLLLLNSNISSCCCCSVVLLFIEMSFPEFTDCCFIINARPRIFNRAQSARLFFSCRGVAKMSATFLTVASQLLNNYTLCNDWYMMSVVGVLKLRQTLCQL